MSGTASPKHIARYSDVRRVKEAPRHRNDAIRRFDSYWCALCDRLGCWPSRENLDPVEMGAAILPWMLLVELREDAKGVFFHYRLCGTEIANLAGCDVTGGTTREVVDSDNLQIIIEPYLYTLRERCPSFWETAVFHEIYRWRPVVRGVWPLSENGRDIDMLVNLTVPLQKQPSRTS